MKANKALQVAAACAALAGACTAPASAQRVLESSLFSGSLGSGARAMGMGGAFIAIADDATASSWNPAGLCVLEKPEASVAFQPLSQFSYGVSTYTRQRAFVAGGQPATLTQRYDAHDVTSSSASFDFASFTFPFRAGSIKLVPQVSYQRVVDFGLDRESEYSYSGDYGFVGGTRFPYSGTAALSAKASGGIDMVTLSLGLSFTEKLYLGVSVNRWGNGSESSARREEQATIASWTEVSDTTFSDGYEGTNVHLGALFKPSQKIRFGVVYKTPFTMDQTWDRTAETTSAVSGNATETIQRTGTIRWPATVGVGIAIMPTDSLTVSTDYTASWWSKADHYFVQTVSPAPAVERQSDDPSLRSQPSVQRVIWPTFYDPAFPESSTNPAQVDTQQARVGVEYMILKPRIFGLTALPLRVGFFSDQQYFKETPSFAKVTYLGISGGIGLVWSRFSLDVAYLHTQGEFFSDSSTPIETITSEQADTFRSHRVYISTTVRF